MPYYGVNNYTKHVFFNHSVPAAEAAAAVLIVVHLYREIMVASILVKHSVLFRISLKVV